MKYTVIGYSQEAALSFKKEIVRNGKTKTITLDVLDLLILRWFADFYPNMSKKTIDEKEYAWVVYTAFVDDFPLLDIKKKTVYERLDKLTLFGILEHKTVRQGGTFSYYSFGENYMRLVSIRQNGEGIRQNGEGIRQNGEGIRQNGEGIRQNGEGIRQNGEGIRQNGEQNNPSTNPSTNPSSNPDNYCPPNGDSPQLSGNGYSFEGEKEGREQPKPKQKRFKKPTVEEIAEYCKSRNNDIDAQHFYDHYESVGWIVGRSPMKDWQATVRNWERRDRDGSKKDNNKPVGYSSYDTDEFFEAALKRSLDEVYGKQDG